MLATMKSCQSSTSEPVVLRSAATPKNGADEIGRFFCDYFSFGKHKTIANSASLDVIDKELLKCLGNEWPPAWCLPSPCVTIDGNRGLGGKLNIHRLFIADLVWLFYIERMGIFRILGAILDDFATRGRKPISNGATQGPENDVLAIILEAMVRQMKSGLSSTVRDRNSTYLRCLGWTSDAGRKLNVPAQSNKKFNHHFHLFIYHALQFYKDKRLAVAIQTTAGAGKPSVATKITLRDTIEGLRKSFDVFDYGRNYNNTLSGLVWAIAGFGVLRGLRTALGIPVEYDEPYEYIPAAFEMFTGQQAADHNHNRFLAHKECAQNARSLLLGIQVLNFQDTSPNGELEQWLELVEDRVEGYRTAYEALAGIDLASSPNPTLEMAT